jgi:hypothetical protein
LQTGELITPFHPENFIDADGDGFDDDGNDYIRVQWTFQEEDVCYYGINFFRFLPSNTISNFHCKYSS